VGLLGDEQPLGPQVFQHAAPGLEAVEPSIGRRRLLVDSGVQGEDVQGRERVARRHLVVVEVVGRGDLHAPGAEFRVHVLVGDDRDRPPGEGQDDLSADQMPVALVIGMDRYRHVSQHSLGAGSGHHHRP
jgi:hypothetical protein